MLPGNVAVVVLYVRTYIVQDTGRRVGNRV